MSNSEQTHSQALYYKGQELYLPRRCNKASSKYIKMLDSYRLLFPVKSIKVLTTVKPRLFKKINWRSLVGTTKYEKLFLYKLNRYDPKFVYSILNAAFSNQLQRMCHVVEQTQPNAKVANMLLQQKYGQMAEAKTASNQLESQEDVMPKQTEALLCAFPKVSYVNSEYEVETIKQDKAHAKVIVTQTVWLHLRHSKKAVKEYLPAPIKGQRCLFSRQVHHFKFDLKSPSIYDPLDYHLRRSQIADEKMSEIAIAITGTRYFRSPTQVWILGTETENFAEFISDHSNVSVVNVHPESLESQVSRTSYGQKQVKHMKPTDVHGDKSQPFPMITVIDPQMKYHNFQTVYLPVLTGLWTHIIIAPLEKDVAESLFGWRYKSTIQVANVLTCMNIYQHKIDADVLALNAKPHNKSIYRVMRIERETLQEKQRQMILVGDNPEKTKSRKFDLNEGLRIRYAITATDTENSQEEDGLAPSVKRVAKSFNKVEFQEILTNLHIQRNYPPDYFEELEHLQNYLRATQRDNYPNYNFCNSNIPACVKLNKLLKRAIQVTWGTVFELQAEEESWNLEQPTMKQALEAYQHHDLVVKDLTYGCIQVVKSCGHQGVRDMPFGCLTINSEFEVQMEGRSHCEECKAEVTHEYFLNKVPPFLCLVLEQLQEGAAVQVKQTFSYGRVDFQLVAFASAGSQCYFKSDEMLIALDGLGYPQQVKGPVPITTQTLFIYHARISNRHLVDNEERAMTSWQMKSQARPQIKHKQNPPKVQEEQKHQRDQKVEQEQLYHQSAQARRIRDYAESTAKCIITEKWQVDVRAIYEDASMVINTDGIALTDYEKEELLFQLKLNRVQVQCQVPHCAHLDCEGLLVPRMLQGQNRAQVQPSFMQPQIQLSQQMQWQQMQQQPQSNFQSLLHQLSQAGSNVDLSQLGNPNQGNFLQGNQHQGHFMQANPLQGNFLPVNPYSNNYFNPFYMPNPFNAPLPQQNQVELLNRQQLQVIGGGGGGGGDDGDNGGAAAQLEDEDNLPILLLHNQDGNELVEDYDDPDEQRERGQMRERVRGPRERVRVPSRGRGNRGRGQRRSQQRERVRDPQQIDEAGQNEDGQDQRQGEEQQNIRQDDENMNNGADNQ